MVLHADCLVVGESQVFLPGNALLNHHNPESDSQTIDVYCTNTGTIKALINIFG